MSNLDISANIFDNKCSTGNKYLIDSSSSSSVMFIFRPISTVFNRERYRRSSCIYQPSRFRIIYYSTFKNLVDVWRRFIKECRNIKRGSSQSIAIFQARDRKKLIDPTPNKIWLSEKAKIIGLTLKKENLKNVPNAMLQRILFLTCQT